MSTYFLTQILFPCFVFAEDEHIVWCRPFDNSGRISVESRSSWKKPWATSLTYNDTEKFLPFIDKYVKMAVRMGSTKHTLCGIVLSKLDMFFSCVSQVPSIDSTCFPHTWGLRGIAFFLINTDSTYSHVPGDQGGPIFFRLKDFFQWFFLRTNRCTTICITCSILRKIECNKFVCNKFVLVLLQIDIMQIV